VSRAFVGILSIASIVVAIAPACLPNDTRPTPTTLNVTVSGSALVDDGIPATSVDDGWSIAFDRVLVDIGNSSVNGGDCTDYAETDYRRLYDASVVAPQKLSLIYGLGTCNFNFGIRNPDNTSTILMQGVTDDEYTTMGTPVQDADRYTLHDVSGVSLWVRGSATNGSTTKTFDWSFRIRRVRIHDCRAPDGTYFSLDMPGGDTLSLDIEIHPEVLFQDRLDWTTARLRFAPFAQADDKFGNADGVITLDELNAMTLADAGVTPFDETTEDADAGVDAGDVTGTDAGDDSGLTVTSPNNWSTFEDFVYLGLYPRVARVAGKKCLSDAVLRVSSG
jgi:hypothetical protein